MEEIFVWLNMECLNLMSYSCFFYYNFRPKYNTGVFVSNNIVQKEKIMLQHGVNVKIWNIANHLHIMVSKWNTTHALIWKEDFGPLGNSPVLLLLGPGETPLTTTLAKFLDTSVCSGSWCLDPSLSPFLVKFTQILESILLDNPHKAAVLSVGCASFSSTLFPSIQLSVNMLGYSTLWTASFFGNECLWLTLLVKGFDDCLLDNCQISSLPHDCVA